MNEAAHERFPVRTIAECDAILTAPGARFELQDAVINGVSMKIYGRAPLTIRAVIEASQAFPDKEYLVYENERVTFGAHYRAVAHLAAALCDTYGVRKGDRVAISMRNYPQWPVAFYACLAIGAIATPLNAWQTADELEYGLADSGAKAAILDGERFDRVREARGRLPALAHIILARAPAAGVDGADSLEAIIGSAREWASLPERTLPAADVGPDDDATILYTSGTTGRPKGALATHRACISNVYNSMACQARSFLRRGLSPPQRDPVGGPQRITLLAIPFFHATGAFANLLPALMNGDKIVSMYKWDAGAALAIIEAERITTFGGVPAIAWQVLEHPERDRFDLSSIQFVSYGGAPSAPELVTSIKRRFPEATASNGWGMTETCATSTLNFGKDYEVRPDSAGACGPAMELRIVAADGSVLPVGEIGELWAKGPNITRCYWNNPEASARTFIDGWCVTGDIARVDDEGFLFLLDRAKDMLIRGGENIYCIEVENALYDHPCVMDAAVVGIPHKVLGEEVGAVVQAKPGMTVDARAIQDFLSGRIAAFKVPVEIHVQSDPLPRNANGKILKSELRGLFSPRG
jgi:long-chain acyl-CoA synthetase